ncbi:Dolichyl-diphosphooligosaccharide-protein glycosyltransferase 48kDa subunit [Basidiobolus meristosporus CBS 931.73]|uniref:Dolichyl-diphosphooligosaccharide--protein glycosyltransferase subunit WBP1 n=1 Tax=Basidiobolus meristosporus CBS 931.73 TaxID=1314790 RepID=A0A1Y1YWA4_9FUNG|nr:Dolichyl-diphosphooligosaccharide-protein glycosyltransferase 48kDa subunit [Basidiobolus meristosporus CBS 931.73]|eukprot:ORY02320.1 Dolichyl-diphosphooligosaccharide-protein glycosyltransferase 48kDa subunit [Basidiobolus meristosporus CBS 931.73]
MRLLYSLLALLPCSLLASAKSLTGDKVLVLLDEIAAKDQYSIFFNSLTERGYQLTFNDATDPSLNLIQYDERNFDHLVLFSPSTKSTPHCSLTATTLVDFTNKGGNILVASSSAMSPVIQQFAAQLGIDFDNQGTSVIDHFQYNETSEHTVIASDRFTPVTAIFSPTVREGAPVLFNGIGHLVSPLVYTTAILKANPTAYSYETKENMVVDDDITLIGSEIALVSSHQALNNARVTFSGSLDLFSDRFATSSVKIHGSEKRYVKSGNEAFFNELSQWTFQEKGVLKAVSVKHHKVEEEEFPGWYRINDNIVYEIELSEYFDNSWHPYSAPDVQFEAIMLDPYVRVTLNRTQSESPSSTKYVGHIALPDVYGVYTLRVNYKRAGLSYVLEKDVVPIRPYRHNEYPRFLTVAFPYYVSAGSMLVGFVVFSIVWLYNRDAGVPKKKTN